MQYTTDLQAHSNGLLLVACVLGEAAATESGSTADVTAAAMIFFHEKRKMFPLLVGRANRSMRANCRKSDKKYQPGAHAAYGEPLRRLSRSFPVCVGNIQGAESVFVHTAGTCEKAAVHSTLLVSIACFCPADNLAVFPETRK